MPIVESKQYNLKKKIKICKIRLFPYLVADLKKGITASFLIFYTADPPQMRKNSLKL